MVVRRLHVRGATASVRAAALRSRDAALGLKQVNVRVPAIWDTTLQILARELREGQRLEGLVVRDPATGRVKTIIV